jgi:uncharacterized integral membrane protein
VKGELFMKSFKRTLILGIIVLFLVFVAQNTHVVSVRFLFWKAEASRVLVLVATFLIGCVAGGLLAWPVGKSHKEEIVGG